MSNLPQRYHSNNEAFILLMAGLASICCMIYLYFDMKHIEAGYEMRTKCDTLSQFTSAPDDDSKPRRNVDADSNKNITNHQFLH